MKKTLVVLAATAMAAAAVAPAGAITYGQPDDPDDPKYPHVGGLVVGYDIPDDNLGEKYRVVCSGTLIGDGRVFLTAAHCIDLGLPDEWNARLGVTFVHDFAPLEVDGAADISSVTWADGSALHPQFHRPPAGDIGDMGVLLFDGPVVGVAPGAVAPLGTIEQMKSDRTLRAAVFTTAGYGTERHTHQGGGWAIQNSTVRQWTEQSYRSHGATLLRLSMNPALGDGGTCYGDSGGPHFDPLGRIVSITVSGDAPCKNLDTTYRADSVSAQTFLSQFAGSGVAAP